MLEVQAHALENHTARAGDPDLEASSGLVCPGDQDRGRGTSPLLGHQVDQAL